MERASSLERVWKAANEDWMIPNSCTALLPRKYPMNGHEWEKSTIRVRLVWDCRLWYVCMWEEELYWFRALCRLDCRWLSRFSFDVIAIVVGFLLPPPLHCHNRSFYTLELDTEACGYSGSGRLEWQSATVIVFWSPKRTFLHRSILYVKSPLVQTLLESLLVEFFVIHCRWNWMKWWNVTS